MMRIVFALLLLLPLSAAQADEKRGQPDSSQNIVQLPAETTPVVQPLPFEPSQQIGADSNISFPTDI